MEGNLGCGGVVEGMHLRDNVRMANPRLDIVNYDVRLRDNYDGRSTGVIVAVNWL
jgi:hypothetical protein